jgi:hypothetical protein
MGMSESKPNPRKGLRPEEWGKIPRVDGPGVRGDIKTDLEWDLPKLLERWNRFEPTPEIFLNAGVGDIVDVRIPRLYGHQYMTSAGVMLGKELKKCAQVKTEIIQKGVLPIVVPNELVFLGQKGLRGKFVKPLITVSGLSVTLVSSSGNKIAFFDPPIE